MSAVQLGLAVQPVKFNPRVIPVRYFEAFTVEECAAITVLGLSQRLVEGMMMVPEEGYRECLTAPIPICRDTQWLATKLSDLVSRANDRFGFDVELDSAQLQFVRYEVNGKIGWHDDYDPTEVFPRKISISVQLSGKNDYDGGALEFFPNGELPVARERGSAIVFPAFYPHRICPITRGTRDALVVWYAGPNFR